MYRKLTKPTQRYFLQHSSSGGQCAELIWQNPRSTPTLCRCALMSCGRWPLTTEAGDCVLPALWLLPHKECWCSPLLTTAALHFHDVHDHMFFPSYDMHAHGLNAEILIPDKMCLLGDIHAIHDLKGDIMTSIRDQQHTKASVKELQTFGGPAYTDQLQNRSHHLHAQHTMTAMCNTLGLQGMLVLWTCINPGDNMCRANA